MFWSTRKIIISTGYELYHPHYAHFTAILAIGLVSKGLNGYNVRVEDKKSFEITISIRNRNHCWIYNSDLFRCAKNTFLLLKIHFIWIWLQMFHILIKTVQIPPETHLHKFINTSSSRSCTLFISEPSSISFLLSDAVNFSQLDFQVSSSFSCMLECSARFCSDRLTFYW